MGKLCNLIHSAAAVDFYTATITLSTLPLLYTKTTTMQHACMQLRDTDPRVSGLFSWKCQSAIFRTGAHSHSARAIAWAKHRGHTHTTPTFWYHPTPFRFCPGICPGKSRDKVFDRNSLPYATLHKWFSKAREVCEGASVARQTLGLVTSRSNS